MAIETANIEMRTPQPRAARALEWVKALAEYLAGERDDAPAGFPVTLGNWLFWGLSWAALAVVIFIFSGQSSKFIYIDF
jgi:hypothetical protein